MINLKTYVNNKIIFLPETIIKTFKITQIYPTSEHFFQKTFLKIRLNITLLSSIVKNLHLELNNLFVFI